MYFNNKNLLILSHGSYQSLGTYLPEATDTRLLTFWMPTYTAADPLWKRELIDFVGLVVVGSLRGLVQSLPLLFISLKFLWLGPIGASMGLAYLIGFKLLPNVGSHCRTLAIV